MDDLCSKMFCRVLWVWCTCFAVLFSKIESSPLVELVSGLSFPQVVLQTRGGSLSSDVQRWRDGCKRLNMDHQFDLYNDSELLTFVGLHYADYLSLFKALSGVCEFKIFSRFESICVTFIL